jgi:hypothetical protein
MTSDGGRLPPEVTRVRVPKPVPPEVAPSSRPPAVTQGPSTTAAGTGPPRPTPSSLSRQRGREAPGLRGARPTFPVKSLSGRGASPGAPILAQSLHRDQGVIQM